jgi:hypothetical protein
MLMSRLHYRERTVWKSLKTRVDASTNLQES